MFFGGCGMDVKLLDLNDGCWVFFAISRLTYSTPASHKQFKKFAFLRWLASATWGWRAELNIHAVAWLVDKHTRSARSLVLTCEPRHATHASRSRGENGEGRNQSQTNSGSHSCSEMLMDCLSGWFKFVLLYYARTFRKCPTCNSLLNLGVFVDLLDYIISIMM